MELPQDVEWQIIKFMRHPIADMYLIENSECISDDDEGETFTFSRFRRKRMNQSINNLKNMSDQHYFYHIKEQLLENAYSAYLRYYN